MATKLNIIVILGPTASGKTSLALAASHALGGAEILSVDSMQVYRGMDIGTAKPTIEEQHQVKHHLIDVATPDQTFAVARFVELADAVINDSANRNTRLIATGGTPLYYKSLFEGLFEGPSADPDIRLRLSAEALETLHARLQAIDPVAAQRIHLNDQRRLIRALEVFELTGQPISSLQNEWSNGNVRHEAIWFGLMWEKEELNRRINVRVKMMIEQGWLEETRALLNQYGDLSQTAAEATGYHELIEHLHGRKSLEEAVEQIKIATRQLARRQMKWFRRFRNVQWLDGSRSMEELVKQVLDVNAT